MTVTEEKIFEVKSISLGFLKEHEYLTGACFRSEGNQIGLITNKSNMYLI
jgi:hypothetical protein